MADPIQQQQYPVHNPNGQSIPTLIRSLLVFNPYLSILWTFIILAQFKENGFHDFGKQLVFALSCLFIAFYRGPRTRDTTTPVTFRYNLVTGLLAALCYFAFGPGAERMIKAVDDCFRPRDTVLYCVNSTAAIVIAYALIIGAALAGGHVPS